MIPTKQAWYIKLARKAGAKTDTQALNLCLLIAAILLIISGILYYRLLFVSNTVEQLDPALLKNMEPRTNQR